MTDEYGSDTGSATYPAYRFHVTDGMRLVKDQEEDTKALEEGYQDHPYTPQELAEAARRQAEPHVVSPQAQPHIVPPYGSGSGDMLPDKGRK